MAKELLETADEELEANACKFKLHCRKELESVVESGEIPLTATRQGSKIWALLNLTADALLVDTQEVEGINSMIRLIGQRCPAISLSSMSSRIVLKKSVGMDLTDTLGQGAKRMSKKWSVIKTFAAPLLDDCIEIKYRYKEVLNDSFRWQTPAPVEMSALSPQLANTNAALMLPTLQHGESAKSLWAAGQAALCKRKHDELSMTHILGHAVVKFMVITDSQDPLASFMVCTSNHSILHMCKASVSSEGHFVMPEKLQFQTSASILAEYYDRCQMHDCRFGVHFLSCAAIGAGAGASSSSTSTFTSLQFQVISEKRVALAAELVDSSFVQPFNCTLPLLQILEGSAASMTLAKVVRRPRKTKPKPPLPSAAADEEDVDVGEVVDDETVQQAVRDLECLECGHGFDGEAETAETERKELSEELAEELNHKRSASRIKQGIVGGSAAPPKRKAVAKGKAGTAKAMSRKEPEEGDTLYQPTESADRKSVV